MPSLALSGVMQGVSTASFYRLTTRALKYEKGIDNVGINKRISLSMLAFSFTGIFTGWLLEKLIDKGRSRVFTRILNTAFFFNTCFMLYIYHNPSYTLIFPVS